MTIHEDPFSSFDPTRYQTVSNLSLQSMMLLGRALRSLTPKDPSPRVEKLAILVDATLVESREAMIVRLRESNGNGSSDQNFDIGVDGLWGLTRDRLLGWSCYEREGLDFLIEEDLPPAQDITTLREQAVLAKAMHARLFGDDGVKFVLLPFPEQCERMATILALIEKDELEDDFVALTGPELLPLLRRCQVRYEAMIQSRVLDSRGSTTNLKALQSCLRRHLVRYAGAVITMLDEDKPETLQIVEDALAPMIAMRQGRSARAEPEDFEVFDDTPPELLSELQASE